MATTYKDKDEEKKINPINGVDEATTNKMNSTFSVQNEETKNMENKAAEGVNRVESLTSKDSIISSDVKAKLNTSFAVPPAVKEADTYLASQLQKIQSGKTSFSDQLTGLMDQIMNREKFSYDVDSDPLFQQALASSMNSGKQAMQDTIGQASALTGGYGSSYATTAGNQAYNAFIEDAYDNLPQYYQMAMEAYQMEGDELYRQLGMLNEADDKEYNRNVTAYDATYQHRNRIYDESYQQFRDSKSDAYNMANLQLNEHGQLVSDAVNYYNVTSDYANTLYNREYQSWADEVNQAMKYAEMLNTDYWNQTNYDRGVYESDRAYERDVFESDRSFNEGVRQYEQNYAQTEKWNQEDLNYKNSALAEDKRQFNTSMGDTNNDGVVSDEEYAKYVERYGSKDKESKGFELSTAQLNAAREASNKAGGGELGFEAAVNELAALGITVDESNADIVMNALKGVTSTSDTVSDTSIKHFRTKEGDNFQVTVNGKTYGVENHGKVTDEATVTKLDQKGIKNGQAFTYNGDAYVKYADGYFKIGAMAFGSKEHQNLLKALQG